MPRSYDLSPNAPNEWIDPTAAMIRIGATRSNCRGSYATHRARRGFMPTTNFEINRGNATTMIAQTDYPIPPGVRFSWSLPGLAVQCPVVSPSPGGAVADAGGRIGSGPPRISCPNIPPALRVGFAGAVRVRALNDSPPHAADARR